MEIHRRHDWRSSEARRGNPPARWSFTHLNQLMAISGSWRAVFGWLAKAPLARSLQSGRRKRLQNRDC